MAKKREDGTTLSLVIKLAYRALYEAKGIGGNVVKRGEGALIRHDALMPDQEELSQPTNTEHRPNDYSNSFTDSAGLAKITFSPFSTIGR